MIEIVLIKLLLLNKELYQSCINKIDLSLFDHDIQKMFNTLIQFHHKDLVSIDDYRTLFYVLFPVKDKEKDYWNTLFSDFNKLDVSTSSAEMLLDLVIKRSVLRKLTMAANSATDSPDKIDNVFNVIDELNDCILKQEKGTDSELISTDLDVLLDSTINAPGLNFRLQALRKSLGPLRKGDAGLVFARPETGKTTFLASEVSYMLPQVTEANPILWLNNEEQGSKVMLRIYQAYFGVSLYELTIRKDHYRARFKEEVGNNILFWDSAHIEKKTVERLCKEQTPGLILFDQVDKIQGFKEDRDDLRLGAIYIWVRELAKEYCPTISVCQADGSAEGVLRLHMGHVANAKTSKQAEKDWILGIGMSHQDGMEYIRCLNVVKNKLAGDSDTDEQLRHAALNVRITPEIARYEDILNG